MKKVITLALALSLLLSACGGGSDPLDAIDGANKDQKAAIQEILDDCGITVKSCEAAKIDSTGDDDADALVGALAASFSPYTITGEDGKTYRMVLKTSDYSITTITDSDGEFVYGGMGSLFG